MKKPPKEPQDALHFFMHAKRFSYTDEYVRSEQDLEKINIMGITTIVLSAFASELHLKCLRIIETGSAPHGHNLKNLYKDLSKQTRAKISQEWDLYLPRIEGKMRSMERADDPIPRDLESLLGMGARAFEGLRYPANVYSTGFFLNDLPRILESVTLQLKPEWRNVWFRTPKPYPNQKPELAAPASDPFRKG